MVSGEFGDLELPNMGETQSELKPVVGMIGLGNLGGSHDLYEKHLPLFRALGGMPDQI